MFAFAGVHRNNPLILLVLLLLLKAVVRFKTPQVTHEIFAVFPQIPFGRSHKSLGKLSHG